MSRPGRPTPTADPSATAFRSIDRPRYHAAGMDDVPGHDAWLTEPESARLRGFAYAKRRDEARLGRWTAKQTVARAVRVADGPAELVDDPAADSATLAALVIRNAADGAPEVVVDGRLAPVHISMTDRADWAVCVALSAERSGGAVGCDLEVVEPRSERFVADWFTASERELVGAAPDERDVLANLIWSAKESALKVLRTGLRRDTRSVEVSFPDLTADGWRALRVDTEEGLSFPGWWRRFGDFVLSFASVAGTPPPAPLTDPSPLLAARPTHRWMDRPHGVGPTHRSSVRT